MTDASQEGTLAEGTLLMELARHLHWDICHPGCSCESRTPAGTDKDSIILAKEIHRIVDKHYRSKGVPTSALEHGRMEYYPHNDGCQYAIVPDSATDGDGE